MRSSPRPGHAGGQGQALHSGSSLDAATAPATGTQKQQYALAADLFHTFLANLRQLVTADLPVLEGELEKAGAPHTPGRFPEWRKE